MKKTIRFCLDVTLTAVLTALWAMAAPAQGVLTDRDGTYERASGEIGETLTNEQITDMVQAGLSVDAIIAKIRASGVDFSLTVKDLIALKALGVDDRIIEAMLEPRGPPMPQQTPPEEEPKIITYPAPGASPQTAPAQVVRAPGTSFRDTLNSGGEGPEMVVIPAGRFRMGCVSGLDCDDDEQPVHEVVIARPFALSKYEVTFADYDKFTYPNRVGDMGWGRGRRPIIIVSWDDANEYAAWLSAQTGKRYRLPSEAEWEYAARAGSTTRYSWGNDIGQNRANCEGCGSQWDNEQTAPVGSFAPNAWGLHDMHGNVWEWVQDCWNDSYAGAPTDGRARTRSECVLRVHRGGSWYTKPGPLRSATRGMNFRSLRHFGQGFRLAQDL